jgi:hypothetical protein
MATVENMTPKNQGANTHSQNDWRTSVSIIEPAYGYGRDYRSKAAAQADLDAGKDFIGQPSGQYLSVRDLRAMGLTSITLRYGKRRKVTTLEVKPEP